MQMRLVVIISTDYHVFFTDYHVIFTDYQVISTDYYVISTDSYVKGMYPDGAFMPPPPPPAQFCRGYVLSDS